MEDVIVRTGLPLEWLTVRIDRKLPEFESGEINLYVGRGGFIGDQADTGAWRYHLRPHLIEGIYLGQSLDGVERLTEVQALFADLAEAMDACYGYVVSSQEWDRYGQWVGSNWLETNVLCQLPNVFWLNYFGPAMVRRWPTLATVPEGRRDLANGGVILRTTETPWLPVGGVEARSTRPGRPTS
jgi:hypothetical protein